METNEKIARKQLRQMRMLTIMMAILLALFLAAGFLLAKEFRSIQNCISLIEQDVQTVDMNSLNSAVDAFTDAANQFNKIDWMQVNVAREWHQEFVPAKMSAIANGWMQRRKVYTHRPVGVSGIAFNIRKPPFDDIRVRKAFSHLYNREKMMDKLFFNEYEFLDSHYPNSLKLKVSQLAVLYKLSRTT